MTEGCDAVQISPYYSAESKSQIDIHGAHTTLKKTTLVNRQNNYLIKIKLKLNINVTVPVKI